MRKTVFLGLLIALLLPIYTFADNLLAPDSGQAIRPNKGIREIKNKFFSIDLPAGWSVEKPIKMASNHISAIFKKDSNIRVALNIFSVPFTSKAIAVRTADKLRQRGMVVSEPQENGDFYTIDISRKGAAGRGWFGSDGKAGASTIIFAPDMKEANALLQALKPAASGIIPQKAD